MMEWDGKREGPTLQAHSTPLTHVLASTQVGAGGIKSISSHKSPMSMNEVLQVGAHSTSSELSHLAQS